MLNLSTDLAVMDGGQTVTWQQRTTSKNLSIAGAIPRATVQSAPGANDGSYQQYDLVWHLPVSEFATHEATPKSGDELIDAAGMVWIIRQAEFVTHGSRWKCSTRRFELDLRFDERVTIEQAQISHDTAGAAQRTWVTLLANVPARIQPVEAQIADAHQAKSQQVTVFVYFSAPQTLGRETRIVAADGRIYHVTGYQQPEQLDKYFILTAEQIAWPLAS